MENSQEVIENDGRLEPYLYLGSFLSAYLIEMDTIGKDDQRKESATIDLNSEELGTSEFQTHNNNNNKKNCNQHRKHRTESHK